MMPTLHYPQTNGFANHGAHGVAMNFHQNFDEIHAEPIVLDQNVQMQQQRLRQSFSATPTMQTNHVNGMPWQQAGMIGSAQPGPSQNAQMPPPNSQMPQGAMNPLMWANMSQAQMQNPMMQMAPFNMFSQQIIQEAFAMAQPVDSSDEPTLLTALLKAKKTDRNFKEALNGLHGTNGHSASLWKDYYLEHKDRIDDWISMCIRKEQEKVAGTSKFHPALYTNGVAASSSTSKVMADSRKTIKKPSPSSFKREPSPPRKLGPSRLSTATPPIKPRPKSKVKSSTPSVQDLPVISGRRSTMNSLSVSDPVFDSRLPAPNASIKIPEPPSRSPTPPTEIVQGLRGNRFTPDDREYFIKFLGWTLKNNSDLTRAELCAMLAEKAPHHTALSWASFWSNNHDIPDKILAHARGDFSDDSEPEVVHVRKKRPIYKDPDTSDDEADSSRLSNDDNESDEYEEEDGDIQEFSESEMSGKGHFNEADFYITAKYIASREWEACSSGRERWEVFEQQHPGRSYKSWNEYHRRNQKGLDRLAARIKRAGTSSVPTQRARPSQLPSFTKRKLEDNSEAGSVKRSKVEESD